MLNNSQNNQKTTEKVGFSKAGLVTSYLIVAALVLTILVNTLAGILPEHLTHFDVSGSDTFRITNETRKFLEKVDGDVTLYLISEGGARATENEIYIFLHNMARINERIKLEVIDPAVNADFIIPYGGEWPENLSVIVKSDKRYQLLSNSDLYYYYVSAMGGNLSAAEYQYYCSMFQQAIQQDPEKYQATYTAFLEDAQPMFDGNSRICNAINYTLMDHIPVAYMLVGTESAQKASSLPYNLQETLLLSGYQLKTLTSTQTIPADCELLVIHTPTQDLSEVEAKALRAYLGKGGKLFLTTQNSPNLAGYGAFPNLASVLAEYGLGYGDMTKIVCESDSRYVYGDGTYTYPYSFYARRKTHAAAGSFSGDVLLTYAHEIVVTETAGVTVTPWLTSSEAGYLQGMTTSGTSETPEKKSLTCGVIAEKGDSRVIWISSASAIDVATNYEWIVSALNWAVGSENATVSIASAAIPSTSLFVTNGQFALWAILLIVVLPLTFLVIGIAIWAVRKKR